jgi:hypothetical protein
MARRLRKEHKPLQFNDLQRIPSRQFGSFGAGASWGKTELNRHDAMTPRWGYSVEKGAP